jgi:hypothetical protein
MILTQTRGYNPGKGEFARPYDSTNGVPDAVFIGFWILILLFLLRLAWEFRDRIFQKKKDKGKQRG